MSTQIPRPTPPRIAVVCIGDELVEGRTIDTNSGAIGALAVASGWKVAEIVTIPDEPGLVESTVERLAERHDWIVTTGGLGPTEDDRTRAAIAAAVGRPLRADAGAEARLRARAAARGVEVTALSLRQSLVPRGARVYASEVGTADPFAADGDGFTVICFPGVPRELRALAPVVLRAELPAGDVRHRLEAVYLGERESLLSERIEALRLPTGVGVTYAPSSPTVTIGVVGPDLGDVERADAQLATALAPWRLPLGAKTAAEAVVTAFTARGWTLATAESCSGGLVAAGIVDIAGASAVLDRGWITYANSAKVDELGVAADAIAVHGAVSAVVAAQMAAGARRVAGVDAAVSVTGVAGPGGGTAVSPVGTVFLAVATERSCVVADARFVGLDRQQFRAASAALAHRLLLAAVGGDYDALRSYRGVRELHFVP